MMVKILSRAGLIPFLADLRSVAIGHLCVYGAAIFLLLSPVSVMAQDDFGGAAIPDPAPPGQVFDFDDESFNFEESPEKVEDLTRKEAFDAALQGLLPLKPEEIRVLLERFDRTQESVELPVYPAPKPEVAVQNIDLDPGAEPPVIKMAYGHVTTVSFMDASGQQWPIHNLSWAGNFQILETAAAEGEDKSKQYSSMFVISPQSEFAYGNISVNLLGLNTPVILTLETNRDVVHYRFDAIMPDYGPLAKAPIMDVSTNGIGSQAGSSGMSSALEGIVPDGAQRLKVSGLDGRTSAFKYNGMTYVRTPLTLLSPGWNGSVSSVDGMRVYEISGAPVLLLSDRGRMVRARLSNREDILDDE